MSMPNKPRAGGLATCMEIPLVTDKKRQLMSIASIGSHSRLSQASMESLILAQDERWRRALHMQVER